MIVMLMITLAEILPSILTLQLYMFFRHAVHFHVLRSLLFLSLLKCPFHLCPARKISIHLLKPSINVFSPIPFSQTLSSSPPQFFVMSSVFRLHFLNKLAQYSTDSYSYAYLSKVWAPGSQGTLPSLFPQYSALYLTCVRYFKCIDSNNLI